MKFLESFERVTIWRRDIHGTDVVKFVYEAIKRSNAAMLCSDQITFRRKFYEARTLLIYMSFYFESFNGSINHLNHCILGTKLHQYQNLKISSQLQIAAIKKRIFHAQFSPQV